MGFSRICILIWVRIFHLIASVDWNCPFDWKKTGTCGIAMNKNEWD